MSQRIDAGKREQAPPGIRVAPYMSFRALQEPVRCTLRTLRTCSTFREHTESQSVPHTNIEIRFSVVVCLSSLTPV
jgi:hypothetical protein